MSLIQCHFDYACSFWYPGLSKLLKNRLQVTQNKIVRFVLKLDPRSHVGNEEFKSLGWLPMHRRVDQIILNHVFKINTGKSADYMHEHFIPASSIHSYGTRFRENGCFVIPKVKVLVISPLLTMHVTFGITYRTILDKFKKLINLKQL